MTSITINLTDEQVGAIVEAIRGAPSDVTMVPASRVAPGVGEPIPEVSPQVGTGTATDAQTDINGVPWHPQHHSSVKSFTSKGVWKRVRGGDKASCDAYEASYRNSSVVQPMSENDIIPGVNTPVQTIIPPETVEPMPTPTTDEPTPMPVPGAMPMPNIIPAAEPVAYEAVLQAFKEAGERIGETEATAALGQIYAEVGVTQPSDLTTNETLRAGVFERLAAL